MFKEKDEQDACPLRIYVNYIFIWTRTGRKCVNIKIITLANKK